VASRRGIDGLVAVKLDRIGRSIRNLIDVVNDLGGRGIDIVILVPGTSPAGQGKTAVTKP
jgi:DNA invertase Pin-like site-specific DNA recombinase